MDAEAQFVATRGYVVIEPEFRGSTGYGDAHFRAGWSNGACACRTMSPMRLRTANNIDFWKRAEAFLAKHLK